MRIRSWICAGVILATGLAGALVGRAAVGFADNEADRLRLWNTDYYELALRKADGRLLYVIDKTTGQQVSPGNIHGPWVLKFSNNTWLDGENFSPSSGSRHFTYAWDAATSKLTLQYDATGTYACRIVLTMTATEGPEVATALTVSNYSLLEMQLLSYPVNLALPRSQLEAFYVPYIEGMRLLPNFFPSNDFYARYPGRMFADFAYADLMTGSLAVYAAQDAQVPVKPATWTLLRDDAYAGGVNKIHHDYELAVGGGRQWTSPTTVLSIGAPLAEAMAAYWTRSGNDAMPTLEQKLGPTLFHKLARAVLLKRDFRQGTWTFNSFKNALATLPAGNLLHFVSFWPRGFDENYPDYLPPDPALGTLAEFQDLTAYTRSAGHLVMPYTNPTWWDNESPTLGALGTSIVARSRTNNLISETYGSHGGYVVSPTSAAVIARQDEVRVDFAQTVPCDFLFEDQVGARDAPTYAAHNSTSDPLYYTQGLIDVAARTATYLPPMSEGGSDRLTWHEAGFCNTLKLGWYAWPDNTFTPYPLAPLWAHKHLYFNCHNLAGTYMAVDTPALTYYVSMGYALSYDLSALNASWLRVLDVCQKRLIARLVGTGMNGFEYLANDGQTRTVFGDGTVVTANLTTGSMAVDVHVIAPSGFLATRADQVLGGVVTQLHGHTLAGSAAHYLFFDYADYRICIYQPRGADGVLSVPRPPDWAEDGRIRAAALATTGALVDQPVTIDTDTLQIDYRATVGGLSTECFVLTYCRLGDADCDGEITLADLQMLEGCLGGPEVDAGAPCQEAFDGDTDADIDLQDVAALQ